MNAALRAVGHATVSMLAETGELSRLAAAAARHALTGPFRGDRFRARAATIQLARAGSDSLPLVAAISFLVGMIISLQSAYQLQQLQAASLVPNLVAISVTRELAPLLTAIIVAGRIGSAIAAELGTMKVSQELDALQVMGIEPVSFLVVPRLIGLLVALPCLTVFSDAIGILGGMAVGVGILGMGVPGYSAATFDALQIEDILTGLVKALTFAAIIGLVCSHQGMTTRGGAEGVGRSTTASVVRSIALIIGADLFVTAIFYLRG